MIPHPQLPFIDIHFTCCKMEPFSQWGALKRGSILCILMMHKLPNKQWIPLGISFLCLLSHRVDDGNNGSGNEILFLFNGTHLLSNPTKDRSGLLACEAAVHLDDVCSICEQMKLRAALCYQLVRLNGRSGPGKWEFVDKQLEWVLVRGQQES